MNRLLHKLLYRILPLGGYLQTVSAMFFLSHRLGIGRHAPATEYTFHLDRLMRAGDLAIDIGANLGAAAATSTSYPMRSAPPRARSAWATPPSARAATSARDRIS